VINTKKRGRGGQKRRQENFIIESFGNATSLKLLETLWLLENKCVYVARPSPPTLSRVSPPCPPKFLSLYRLSLAENVEPHQLDHQPELVSRAPKQETSTFHENF
jgi:hypothetical protein